jgi:addiction module RelE/StbE family toxin
MVQIKWLKTAQTDLKEIYDYISLDSRIYAKSQIQKIQQSTEILKSQKLIGKVVPEIMDNSVREIIIGNYRIIYLIKNEHEINILLVHHGAKDLIRRIELK